MCMCLCVTSSRTSVIVITAPNFAVEILINSSHSTGYHLTTMEDSKDIDFRIFFIYDLCLDQQWCLIIHDSNSFILIFVARGFAAEFHIVFTFYGLIFSASAKTTYSRTETKFSLSFNVEDQIYANKIIYANHDKCK